jgi:predicted MFS family arabinose efflux permease
MGSNNMTSYVGEGRAIFWLASILSFRMLGLFMIFPVFAIYAPTFKYSTPLLIGIALGIYGLTQALLQLPLSILSDHIGRKPIVIGGLVVFALGSIVAALANNIYVLILGRALQGAGAIGSTLIALTADLTSVENRTKAMAILGMTIGLSFALAMVFGPLINSWYHLSGIFWLTAIFAFLGMIIFQYCIPRTKNLISHHSPENVIQSLQTLLKNKQLFKLNISIFLLHALLTGSFIVIPLLFQNAGIHQQAQWKIYLPVLSAAFISTLPLLFFAEKKHCIKLILLAGITSMAVAEFLLYRYSLGQMGIIIVLFIFFTGFTLLEAILPSLISKIAPSHQKGSAMGLYSSFQFLGIFAGGFLAGLVRSHYGNNAIFFVALVVCTIWLASMLTIEQPPMFKTKLVALSPSVNIKNAQQIAQQLLCLPGVIEANVSIEDCIAYLKIDNKMFNQDLFDKAKLSL